MICGSLAAKGKPGVYPISGLPSGKEGGNGKIYHYPRRQEPTEVVEVSENGLALRL